MRIWHWKLVVLLAGLALVGGYVAAQASVACTPVAGAIIENFNEEFGIGEGPLALGVVFGDLTGGTFSIWPPAGGDAPGEGVFTLDSGDTLRVRFEIVQDRQVESGVRHLIRRFTIRSGTGAYQRASGSFEAHGSMSGVAFDELVTRYQGEVCLPVR